MEEQMPPSEGKRDNPTTLWDLAHSFSEEAQLAAKKKAIELGFAFDRGSIPFEETLINLSRARDLLISAIEQAALPQLPLKLQNQLVADAKRVSAQLTQLTNGADSIVALESAVDDLTADIWQSNLQNMSGEVLGFQKKQNQLKTLESTLKGLALEAESFKQKEAVANDILHRIQNSSDQALSLLEATSKNSDEIGRITATTRDAEQQIAASLALVQQESKSIAQSAALSNASAADLEAHKVKGESIVSELDVARGNFSGLVKELSDFKQRIEREIQDHRDAQKNEYKALDEQSRIEQKNTQASITEAKNVLTTTITSTLKSSIEQFDLESKSLVSKIQASEEAREQKAVVALKKSTDDFAARLLLLEETTRNSHEAATAKSDSLIADSEQRTKERFDELHKLEDIIREKIRLATNYQLFHAFQTRQLAIAEGKNFWRNALFGLVGLSFLLAALFIAYLFKGHPTYDASFYLKLSISFPLVYAIHFCSAEYSKERKLEEEYAFKGNISISLEPYRELVEKMIDKNDPAEAAKYSDFVIASIDKVFASPTPQTFGAKEGRAAADEISDTSKGITKILGSVNDLLQSMAKFK